METLPTRPSSALARTADGVARLVGVAASATFVLLAILMGGMGIGPYIDVPSVFFVAVPTIGLTVACFGVRAPAESVAFLVAGEPSQEQLSRGTGIAFSVGGFGLGTGMLGSLIGCIQMLQNMSDPTAIGPAMAVTLLTTLYGVGVAVTAFACGLRLAARSGRGDVVGAAGALGSTALALAGVALYGPTVAAVAGTMFLVLWVMA